MDRDWSKLRKWLIKKRLEGKPVTAICAEAQVDRKMFYRWWSRDLLSLMQQLGVIPTPNQT